MQIKKHNHSKKINGINEGKKSKQRQMGRKIETNNRFYFVYFEKYNYKMKYGRSIAIEYLFCLKS